ncbi:MAG TPA: DNA recombination protein RmuC [Jiangellaceae bacterium]
MDGMGLLLLTIGVVLGAVIGALAMRSASAGAVAERDAARSESDVLRKERDAAAEERDMADDRARDAERELSRLTAELSHAREGQKKLSDEFERLSAQALAQNNERFLQLANERFKSTEQKSVSELEQRRQAVEALVKPLTEQLGRVESQLNSVEKARTDAYAELREQVRSMGQTSEQLRLETSQLVTALRAPQVRGRWGEMQLRRVVETAGMVEHCDFDEQESLRTDDGVLRPDLVIRMAGGKNVVVDSKVPVVGWLEAMEAREDEKRDARLKAHVRHVRDHIDALAAKKYWEHLDPAPEFVVMFVPAEVFLNAALDQDPSLLEYAFEQNVVIATPPTLIALLRTIAYTWRQEALARNAQDVLRLGRDLHGRLATLGGHVNKLGNALSSAVNQYNATVASLESRVLVSARRFADLKVADEDLAAPQQVEKATRKIQATELVASATEALIALDDIETDPRYGVRGEITDSATANEETG